MVPIHAPKTPCVSYYIINPSPAGSGGGAEMEGRVASRTTSIVELKGHHSRPTYLNQFGRQSSFRRNDSPWYIFPTWQPLHFGELGQFKKGTCW